MTAAERRAAESAARVAGWQVLEAADRAALIDRLRNPAVRRYQTGGYGVDVGGDFPAWCADFADVRRLRAVYDDIAADLAASGS